MGGNAIKIMIREAVFAIVALVVVFYVGTQPRAVFNFIAQGELMSETRSALAAAAGLLILVLLIIMANSMWRPGGHLAPAKIGSIALFTAGCFLAASLIGSVFDVL
jgi:hypothetical protein